MAGPTASGKSALALALAQRLGGTVINADAMQCYRELRVITARPSAADEDAAPHRLYGVKAADEPANAAWWRGAAQAQMEQATLPILCGGTGMYFSSLINGIAEIPAPKPEAREEARRLVEELGPEAVHRRLDPETAARLQPADSQRVARAYEVLLSTGKGISWWQAQPTARLTGWRVRMVLLDPPREALREAIAGRFAAMLAQGALEELRGFLALALDPALPLMRALGVPELAAHLRGEVSLDEAVARAIITSHRYTKRQGTWFRHQKLVENSAMQIISTRTSSSAQFSESFMGDIVNFINPPVDRPRLRRYGRPP